DFLGLAAGLLASVVGHNYPVWLRFKGGRGLATACGGLLLLATGYVIVWCTIWAVLKWQKQTILASNLLATLATPVVLLLLPEASLEALVFVSGTATNIRWLALAMSVILLLSHRDAFAELKQKKGE
ncbi:MAG TPA: glycerol-3-phosphate acyltransferase, partial [Bacteroidota bacterium]|nr:glycerol-3-phosphate acyltransferase [Bacteroidota bacterium]